jgi:hypothetical protein
MTMSTYNYDSKIYFDVGKGSYLLGVFSSVWNNIFDEKSALQIEETKISIIKNDTSVVTMNVTHEDVTLLLVTIDREGQENEMKKKEGDILRGMIEVIVKIRMDREYFNDTEKKFISDRVDEELKGVTILAMDDEAVYLSMLPIYRKIVKEVTNKFPMEDNETTLLYKTVNNLIQDMATDYVTTSIKFITSVMEDNPMSC